MTAKLSLWLHDGYLVTLSVLKTLKLENRADCGGLRRIAADGCGGLRMAFGLLCNQEVITFSLIFGTSFNIANLYQGTG